MNRARTTPSLDDIRRDIDALDAQLLELLEQRFEAIEKIRAAKRQAGDDAGSPMRPGREAVVLRRLDGLRRGHLPQSLMVRLWRSIFSAATTVQGRAAVHVTAEVMADPRLAACVLEQFPGLKLQVADDAGVVAAIAATSPDIAIMPRTGSWVEAFDNGSFGEAKVIGCLPLLMPGDSAPDLLIFGHAMMEATGADRTVAVLRGNPESAAALKPLWSAWRDGCAGLCLDGYLAADAQMLTGLPIRIAGHYPSPLEPRK